MKKLLILLLLLTPFAAHAAEDGTLSLAPAVVMLKGEYGQSTTQTMTLTNGTSRAFSFDLVAMDVVVRDGKRVFVEAGTIAGSIAATAVFSQKHVDIPPNETAAVAVTVTLAAGAQHRAVVISFRGTNKVMSGHVPMTASLGALLTFNLDGAAELSAADLHVRPQSATENLAVAQTCTNSGREPFVAKGVMAVVDERGSLVGRSSLEPRRLLPGESTRLGGEFGGELASGKYRVVVTYDYDGGTLTRSAEVVIP
ncbi:MAG TPA: hypothetical protein VGF48_21275 [Thermoanaerobaculia bacterium]|jgi:hypothetical protein